MVIFRDDDTIDQTLFKLLLVIIEKNEIEFINNTINGLVNKSGLDMEIEETYEKLINKLKEKEYINKRDEIKVSIEGSILIHEKSEFKYHNRLIFSLKGNVNLIEKGKEFMKNYREMYQ